MTEHLDADALADLQEGLLDAAGEAAARRHLEACPGCRGDLAALTALAGHLAAAGDVGPVPELVAARLDRALAAAATDPVAPTAARTVTPVLPAGRGPVRGVRILQAAAAVVLVLGISAIGISALPRGGTDATSSSAGGSAGDKAAPEAAGVPITESGRDWGPATVAAAAPRLAEGTLGTPVYRTDPQLAPGDTSGGAGGAAGTPAPAASGPAALADPASLADCVTNLTAGTGQPLAVDLAKWRGQPAAVLVFPSPDDPAALDVFVVEPSCPPGLLLHFARVPRS